MSGAWRLVIVSPILPGHAHLPRWLGFALIALCLALLLYPVGLGIRFLVELITYLLELIAEGKKKV